MHAIRLDVPARARLAGHRLLDVGAMVALVGGVLLVVASLANQFLLDGEVSSIDGRLEQSVWTWASSAATFAGAFAATVWSVVSPRHRASALVVAFTLAFFSLDDALTLHEGIGSGLVKTLELPSWVGGLWLMAYPPLLVVATWALVSATWNRGPRIRRATLVGLALLGAGLLLELVGIPTKRLEVLGTDWPHAIRGAFEEGAELSGWIVIASALTATLVLELARVLDGPDHADSVESSRPRRQVSARPR